MFGVELELSDIKTADAARLVYRWQGMDLSSWRDRFGPHAKPPLRYDRWECISDGSILNADGSRCMWTYRNEEGRLVEADCSEGHPDHFRWQGAELVSPVYQDDDPGACTRDLSSLLPRLAEAGATTSKANHNSLHVHVAIDDSWQALRHWPSRLLDFQHTVDELSTGWHDRVFFSRREARRYESSHSPEDLWKRYRTRRFRVRREDSNKIRRLIDIGPRLSVIGSGRSSSSRPSTIEFRCFTASWSLPYVEGCIRMALDTTRCLRSGNALPGRERIEHLSRVWQAAESTPPSAAYRD